MLYGNVICQQEVAMEGETGKLYRASFRDRQGRSVLILRPGMQVSWFGYGDIWLIGFRLNYSLCSYKFGPITNFKDNYNFEGDEKTYSDTKT